MSVIVTLVLSALLIAPQAANAAARTFNIEDDRFVLDGQPIQIISGGIHYFRIHPTYWRDRLERCKALGLNTAEIYVPWNLHEPYPGEYNWEGMGDLQGFIRLAADLGFLVQVRAGPYICAEWEFGGFPWWLGSSEVAGGRAMKLRTADPAYLQHVDRWWSHLFAQLRPHLLENGGPIIMLQIENEYGFCGGDVNYMKHLAATVRQHLGPNLILYTTDPAHVAADGTIPGEDVFTAVDFGPQWFNPEEYYAVQKTLNAPGKSPPFDSEFYTGWLSHWGEQMANTSAEALAADTLALLQFANNTGGFNFYMVHGGTNFGFWAGANIQDTAYQPHITSYDYSSPISEAGDFCQPGIGGLCKYQMLQEVIAKYKDEPTPALPPRPSIKPYGSIHLTAATSLLNPKTLHTLAGEAIQVDLPDTMEQYGQPHGLILYRTMVNAEMVEEEGAELDLGPDIHDYASVFLDGELVGRVARGGPAKLTLPSLRSMIGNKISEKRSGDVDSVDGGRVRLEVLVEAMGRQNFGCDKFGAWDLKGLQTCEVKLAGTIITGWEVNNLPLDDLSALEYDEEGSVANQRRLMATSSDNDDGVLKLSTVKSAIETSPDGPKFYRGTLTIEGVGAELVTSLGGEQHLADTYLDTTGWGKGIAWVNGFNLGWYWPSLGPQMTLYIPGPVLKPGENEVVLLEVESFPEEPTVTFTDQADFYGPGGVSNNGAVFPTEEDVQLGKVQPYGH